jgi:hypothetical protein
MTEFKEETKQTSLMLHGYNIMASRAVVTVTAVAMEQLCGHDISPATRGHAIMEDTFSVQSLPELYNVK